MFFRFRRNRQEVGAIRNMGIRNTTRRSRSAAHSQSNGTANTKITISHLHTCIKGTQHSSHITVERNSRPSRDDGSAASHAKREVVVLGVVLEEDVDSASQPWWAPPSTLQEKQWERCPIQFHRHRRLWRRDAFSSREQVRYGADYEPSSFWLAYCCFCFLV